MEFNILGVTVVRSGDLVVPLGGFVQRATLGILALNANEVVATSNLLRALWPDGTPPTARKMLQNAVSGVRRLLADHGGGAAAELVTTAPGYLLRVDPDRIDITRFRQLAAAGRAELADGAWRAGAELLRESLATWRGPVLADVVEHGVTLPKIAEVQSDWLSATEDLFDAELLLGRHHEVVGALEARVRAEPLRERLQGQYMVALYRCGRQVDALRVYREVRATLHERFGVEPSPRLSDLHEMILRHDARLAEPPYRALVPTVV